MSVTTPGRPASPENSAANESDEANGAPARELLRAQREGRLASPARGGQGSPNKSPARETALSWSDCLMELAAEGPNHQRQAATPTPSRRVGCTARAGGCQTKAPQRSAGERAGLSQHAGRQKGRGNAAHTETHYHRTVTVAQRRGAPRKVKPRFATSMRAPARKPGTQAGGGCCKASAIPHQSSCVAGSRRLLLNCARCSW